MLRTGLALSCSADVRILELGNDRFTSHPYFLAFMGTIKLDAMQNTPRCPSEPRIQDSFTEARTF